MIENLRVKNVALIKELEVEFDAGLNILSGETGAGKSMVIDAIIFLLGGRAGKDFIRSGEDAALVEGMLHIREPKNAQAVKALGIDVEDDSRLLASRSLSAAGKSVCRLNGRAVTVGMLREIASLLLDVHGQHEHQSLLNPAKHIELLDKYCGERLDGLKTALGAKVKSYREVLRAIKTVAGNEKERSARVEMLTFQKKEIEAAKLKPDEEEALSARRDVLAASETLARNAGETLELLYGGNTDDRSALSRITRSLTLMREVAELDGSARGIADALDELNATLDDTVHELRRYWERLDSDPGELDRIESRLDLIYRLKKKYGSDVREIIETNARITRELDEITGGGAQLEQYNAEKKRTGGEILALCIEISKLRRAAADAVKTRLEEVLRELGMKNVRFGIVIEKKNEFGPDGYDKVEFMISPNAGEPLKPLSKIASGGEMSRVMLALKTVLADADQVETFIFDEIDAGVSGRTAQQVAEKLSLLGGRHQLLCITHLPQIASMADAHFLIEKQTSDGKTSTGITALDRDASVRELARLIGGAKITDATVKAAREMKDMALELKCDAGA